MAAVADRPPPSVAAIAASTAIISLLVGYYLGQARSIGLVGQTSKRQPSARIAHLHEDKEADVSSTDSESGDDLGQLKTFAGSEECKLVLVVRTDLGMGKEILWHRLGCGRISDKALGKIAAQCSHATLACYKTLLRQDSAHPLLKRWEKQGQAKVALKVDSEEDLLLLQAQAVSLGLCAQIIHDAGRTQIASGSATVVGIGPAPKSTIDEVTGHLKLL